MFKKAQTVTHSNKMGSPEQISSKKSPVDASKGLQKNKTKSPTPQASFLNQKKFNEENISDTKLTRAHYLNFNKKKDHVKSR